MSTTKKNELPTLWDNSSTPIKKPFKSPS